MSHEFDHLLLTSHDCDILNARITKEPLVEVLRGRVLDDPAGPPLECGILADIERYQRFDADWVSFRGRDRGDADCGRLSRVAGENPWTKVPVEPLRRDHRPQEGRGGVFPPSASGRRPRNDCLASVRHVEIAR